MEIYVGRGSEDLGDDKFIPIYTDDYTLWVNDDPLAPYECRGYAQKVATILNIMPELLAACKALIAYRDAAGPLNFQLEKADDFINMMRAAIARAEGGGNDD